MRLTLHLALHPKIRDAGRMKDTAAFHSTEKRFRAYFDGSPDCMFHIQVEPDGRFTYVDVNPAGLEATGLAIEDMRQREPLDLLGPEKGAEMTAALKSVVETGEPYRYEPTWEMKTEVTTYDATYIPLRDSAGHVTAILGSARNISERKMIEAALDQARKVEVIGQLASGIAHDFNNLISSFQACLRLLEKDPEGDRRRLILDEGQAALERGKALTSWLTGFIRQEPVTLETIDLNAVITPMQSMLEQCLAVGIVLQMDLSAERLPARADQNEIGLALLNLGLNAKDAMPDGGTLRISTRSDTISQGDVSGLAPVGYAVIDVADTGTGIPADLIDQVLEPFFTTKPAGRGTGLGLSMVAGIMKRAGGELRISSAAGNGTCVSLYFPACGGSDI